MKFHYSKQIHDTHRHDMYREAIILNVFYKNIHSNNIYSKQCDIDIINELSLVALYIYIYMCVCQICDSNS